MIDHLTGTVTSAGATHVVVDLGGFGIRALCTPATAAAVRPGERTHLATSLVVREDSLTLYAFADPEERDAFELVQSASGIGPKIAQAVVAVLSPDQLRRAIQTEDLVALCKVPGIGRKGAQKMVIELKDKVAALGHGEAGGTAPAAIAPADEWREQVRLGLEGLGWSTRDAEAAVERVAPMADEEPAPGVAVLMRAALRTLAK